jgi:hypothetical protein
MAHVIYALCALTSLACAWLLLRGYVRTHYKLLFWSGLCFVGLTANNVLLVLDELVLPEAAFRTWRLCAALIGLLLLLYGLISQDE